MGSTSDIGGSDADADGGHAREEKLAKITLAPEERIVQIHDQDSVSLFGTIRNVIKERF